MVNICLDFVIGLRLVIGWGRCVLCVFKSKLIVIFVFRVIEEIIYINIFIVLIFFLDFFGNMSIYV